MKHELELHAKKTPRAGNWKFAGGVGCVSIVAVLAIMYQPWLSGDRDTPRDVARVTASTAGAPITPFEYFPDQFPAPVAAPEEHIQAF